MFTLVGSVTLVVTVVGRPPTVAVGAEVGVGGTLPRNTGPLANPGVCVGCGTTLGVGAGVDSVPPPPVDPPPELLELGAAGVALTLGEGVDTPPEFTAFRETEYEIPLVSDVTPSLERAVMEKGLTVWAGDRAKKFVPSVEY